MASDRWIRVMALLDEALDRPPDERLSFLDQATDDPALRTRVAALLAAADEPIAWLNDGVAGLGQPILHDVATDTAKDAHHEGERLGAYRLVERIARGGMSTVYRAERVDGAYEQQVAVKLLPRYVQTERHVERFRAERHMLARLNHPHIARLLDGGVAENGRPYLVMEYVDGVPITTYCARAALPVRARMALLRTVCAAVQHAHQQLIIHRDLKPANILVSANGQVKLLDFGIAKLLHADDQAPGASPQTRTGERLFTPAYAAPEQITGAPVSTATDVYQLGIIGYELLTGVRPFHQEEKSPPAIARAVMEDTPTKPSTVVTSGALPNTPSDRPPASPRRWRRALCGDVDTIVMKALRKEPERRYTSAEALGEDLTRYLQNVPVRARRSTVRYRTRKFYQRHRAGVMGSAVAVLLIVGLMLGLLHQRNLALDERDRATQQQATSEQVANFLVGVFEASNPFDRTAPAEEPRASELLRRGTGEVQTLEDQPAVQADLLDAMGQAYTGLGDYATADSLHLRAQTLRAERFDAPHEALARSLNLRAAVAEKQGDYAASEALTRKALSMRKALHASPHPGIAEGLHSLALARKEQGDYAAADSLYRQALAMRRALHGAVHEDVASTLTSLGMVRFEQGRYAEAEALHREAFALNEQVVGARHPQTAISLNNMAMAVENQGHYAVAIPLYRQVLDIQQNRLGKAHPTTVTSLNNLAVAVEKSGDLGAATSLKREAMERRREALGADHPRMAAVYNNFGVLLHKKGAYREALQYFQQAIDVLEPAVGLEHPYVAFTKGGMARAHRALGALPRATALAEASLQTIEQHLGPAHPRTAAALSTLGQVRTSAGAYDEAIALHKKALALRQDALDPAHPDIATSLAQLATAFAEASRYADAEPPFREALALRTQAFGSDDVRTARAASGLGQCLVARGAYAEAEPLLLQALTVLEEAPGDQADVWNATRDGLATIAERRNQPDTTARYRATARSFID